MERSNTEYHGRQRLRPWLISKIDSQKFPGLSWVDRPQLTFRVPWKHGGKQDWSANNSLIFKEWALHTGKHKPGVDKEDWPVWKTRFRCAMNKLPDIQEIKELSQLDGEDPYRVYQFLLTTKNSIYVTNHQNKLPNIDFVKHEQFYQPVPDNAMPINLSANKMCIPETVKDMNSMEQEDEKAVSLTSDLGDIDVQELVGNVRHRHVINETVIKQEEDMDVSDSHLMVDENAYPTDIATGAPLFERHRNIEIPRTLNILTREPQGHELIVRLQFRQQVVAQHHITNSNGVRLYHGQQLDDRFVNLYGPSLAQPIEFPVSDSWLNDYPEQKRFTDKLLGCLDRGLTLECRNGDIYAIRKCRVVVFASTPGATTPMKLSRSSPGNKIFDYQQFKIDLQNYANGQGSKPSPHILLGFGQNWCNSLEPYQNLLISATIYHPRAIYDLSKVAGTGLLSPAIQISESDDVDSYIKIYKELTAVYLQE